VFDSGVNDPHRHGIGPAEFTTGVALVPWIVWDVNGYYRSLGLKPNASRSEIRRAYTDRNGQENERLTYIVKVLLDDERRRSYDSCPLGSLWFDRYLEEVVLQEIANQTSEVLASGVEAHFESIRLDDLREKPLSVLDDGSKKCQYDQIGGWAWGYFLWRTNQRDTERLRRWQSALLRGLGSHHRSLRISVGYFGSPGVAVKYVGGSLVVFMGEHEEPSDALVAEATERIEALISPS
jgi:hypothetical protein